MPSIYLQPGEADFAASAFPALVKNNGTNFPVFGLAFDASSAENAYWKFEPTGYASGNLTCEVIWYADTSTTSTHGVTWQAAIAAITPSSDTQNVETKAFATATTGTTDLGSTDAQKLIRTTVTISNLDSIAAGDEVWLRLTRLVSDGSDDLTGDAIVTSVRLSWT